jgi:hypothetical protein
MIDGMLICSLWLGVAAIVFGVLWLVIVSRQDAK